MIKPWTDFLPVLLPLLILGTMALRAFRLLTAVKRKLTQEQKALSEVQTVFESFPLKMEPEDVKRLCGSRPALITELIDGAYRTRSLPNANMDVLLNPLVEETNRWLTPLRGSPNLLMLSGLVVTLVGLSLTISRLQLDNVTAVSLAENLPKALSQMGSAFFGSMFGVLGAILLSWKLADVVRDQQLFLQNLSSFAHTRVAPMLVRPRLDEQVELLTKAVTSSSELYQQVRAGIDESTRKFGELLNQAGGLIARQLTELKKSAEEVYGTLIQVSGDVKSGARALQESSRDLNTYHGELRNAHTELEKMFKRSQDDLDRRSADLLGHMNEMQRAYGESSQEVMGQVLTAVTRLDEVYVQVGRATEQFERSGDQMAGAAQASYSQLHGLLDSTLGEHKREMTSVSEKLNSFTQTLTAVVDINRDLQRISEGVKLAEDQRAAAVVSAMESTRESVSASVQQLVQRLTDQQVLFRDATIDLGERVGGQIGRVTQAVLAQPDQFTAMLHTHKEQIEELQISLAEAIQHATTALGDLVRDQPRVVRDLLTTATAAQVQAVNEQTLAVQGEFNSLTRESRELLTQLVETQHQQFKQILAAQQGDLRTQLKTLSNGLGTQVEAVLESHNGQQAKQQRILQEHIGRLSGAIKDQGPQFEAFLAAQNANNAQVAGNLAQYLSALETLLGQQAEQANQVVTASMEAQERSLGQLSTTLHGPLEALNAHSARLSELSRVQFPQPESTPIVTGLKRVEDELSRGMLRLEQGLSRLQPVRPSVPEPVETGSV